MVLGSHTFCSMHPQKLVAISLHYRKYPSQLQRCSNTSTPLLYLASSFDWSFDPQQENRLPFLPVLLFWFCWIFLRGHQERQYWRDSKEMWPWGKGASQRATTSMPRMLSTLRTRHARLARIPSKRGKHARAALRKSTSRSQGRSIACNCVQMCFKACCRT